MTQSGDYERQKKELLRLRGEVSQLRRQPLDQQKLKQNVEALRAEAEAAKKLAPKEIPLLDSQKVRAYWSKDQIAFAGHADHTSAIQSTLWAFSKGDPAALESTFAPEAWRDFQYARSQTNAPDPLLHQSNLIKLREAMRPVTGFYLISDDITPRIPDFNQNYHLFKIYFEGEGATRTIGLTKVGNEWKFEGVFEIGGTDQKPEYVSTLWP